MPKATGNAKSDAKSDEEPLRNVLTEPTVHTNRSGRKTIGMLENPAQIPELDSYVQDVEEAVVEMDVVSATVSITALLTIAAKVVQGIYAAAHFPTELADVADEVSRLTGILNALKPVAATPSSSPSSLSTTSDSDYETVSSGRTRNDLSIHLQQELTACKTTLVELDRVITQLSLKRGQRIGNMTRPLWYSLKKTDIQNFVAKLERHKNTFVLILSSQGTYEFLL